MASPSEVAGGKRTAGTADGFTMLEVVISLGIAAVAIITLIVFFAYTMENIRVGKSIAQATALAQRHMERLKADPNHLKTLIGVTDTTGEAISEILYDPVNNEAITYGIYTNVERLPSPRDRVVDILVEIRWKYKDVTRSINLESYVNMEY